MNSIKKNNRGFTLLLATLIASLMSALGISMFAIAQKEVVLSGLGRDSQFAFYAADTAAECTLYWDFAHDVFKQEEGYKAPALITCDSEVLNDFPVNNLDEGLGYDGENGLKTNADGITKFWFEPDEKCAFVTVVKSDTHPRTKIEALGYSTKCSDPNNRRRLERAVRLSF